MAGRMGGFPGTKSCQMNKGYHKKLPVSSIPLSRCSVILHTLFKLDFFLTFESRKENVELEQEGGVGCHSSRGRLTV